VDLGVQVFRLSEESLRLVKRRQLLVGSIWLCLVLVMLAAAGVWAGIDLGLGLLALAALAVVATIGSLSLRNRVALNHRTWGLAIGPDVLRFVSAVAPPVEMTRFEVVRVQEAPSGLLLEATSPARVVFVPANVERVSLDGELLTAWRTPEPLNRRGPTREAALGAMAVAVLAWLGGRYLENPVLAGASALLYLGVVAWLTRIVFREPLVPPRQKAFFVLFTAAALLVLIWRFVHPILAAGTP